MGHGARQANTAPSADRGAPADGRSGEPRDDVQHEIGEQAPEGEPHHETLGQRHAVVGLPQHHPHDDVAHRSQGDELCRQQQKSRNYRRIKGQAGDLHVFQSSARPPPNPTGELNVGIGDAAAVDQ